MDCKGHGFCTPQDISGGERPDEIRNIVDANTVRAVCGDECVGLNSFLELMCDDEYRGHDESTRVCLRDGRYITRQPHDAVGFCAWVLEDEHVTPEGEQIRRVVDALEAEIVCCRAAAEKERKSAAGRWKSATVKALPEKLSPTHHRRSIAGIAMEASRKKP